MDAVFHNMGLFCTREPWRHRERTETTHEIVAVTEGELPLFVGERTITLAAGQALFLPAGVPHGGTEERTGTSFYWLHFSGTDFPPLPEDAVPFRSPLLRELMHYSTLPSPPKELVQCIFRHFLLLFSYESEHADSGDRLTNEVVEWLRINCDATTTVARCAVAFGYNPEHLSRLLRAAYGKGMKEWIDTILLDRAKEQLTNTNRSGKEIAALLRFASPTAFRRFFTYHQGISPSDYRAMYPSLHMNNH